MTLLPPPLPLPPASARPVRSLGPAVLALAAAVGIPLAVATASPHAHDRIVAIVLLLVGTGFPVYVIVAPVYRWLFSDEPLAAGFLRNVDPRLALIALRTDVAPHARPLVSVGLVLACVLGFVAVDDPWLYGFRPDAPADWLWTLGLSMWLHADLEHLAGNLLFLWPMAAALEGRIARGRLVALFVAAGVAGDAASLIAVHAWGDEFSSSIGASGAIAGLMGLVVVRCGFARVAIGVPLLGAAGVSAARVRIPAPVWAGLYFAIDLSAAFGAREDHISHWAHIGGYLFGVLAALALRLHRAAAREHLERRALSDPSPDSFVSTHVARDALLALEPNHVESRVARAREASRGARPAAAATDYTHAIRLLLRTQRQRAAALFVEYHRKFDAPLPLPDQLALTPALAALGEHDRAARALADAAHAPDADPALCGRALLQEGRLLEALALSDAARRCYDDLLLRYPESAEAELATARLAMLAERTRK
ncbi:rhomboid family intramembrane serine protease [Myxococcota bacterium]|nr:rhomboid family intramembrane serine protease [Myxococcota bacterium]MCZ7617606.1 rhomboid family intramembrane serine protease [Myxococcota bacterium]